MRKSDRPTAFAAEIPAEPDGLAIVLDRDGDVWQRQGQYPDSSWSCAKPKLQGLFGGVVRSTRWRHLVYAFGPLTAVHWDESA
jgi:hypothetical protein